MTIFKKFTALCLALLLLLPGTCPVQAAQNHPTALVRDLVNYYHYYQEDAALDYELILEQIRGQDSALADTWANILTFWNAINDRDSIYSNVLPDGLPEDDSLCIVVMGYQLQSNGSMRPELEARMEVALASARKYPNAYILCTGGGTASKNKNTTEAGQMAKWLRQHGIDSSRIIVEGDAMSTIQNAIYGCKLLYRDYPQVRSLAIITSDYHIYNSCLYFHTQAALDAYQSGIQPMRVVANATCQVNPDALWDLNTQVTGIGMLTGMDNVERMNQPWLTYLDYLQVTGITEYAMGSELDLQVTAVYSNGYSRDVTARCNYTGFDFGQSGSQNITVSYEEGLAQKAVSFDVYVIPPEGTRSPSKQEIFISAPEAVHPEQPQETVTNLKPALIFAGICLILLVILLWIKAKQAKKRRRRRRRPINLS